MADVVFKVDAETAKAVDGFLKLVDAQKKTEDGMDKMGRGARKGNEEFGALAKNLEKVGDIAKGAVGSLMGLGIIEKLSEKNRDALAKVKEALKELATQAVATQSQLQMLAEQEGLSGPEGLRQAVRTVNEMVQRTGATPQIASEARRAALSLIPDRENALQIGDLVAGTMAKTGGTFEQTTAVVEMLQRIPGAVDSRENAATALSKVQQAMWASGFSTLGEMSMALGRGANQFFVEGASLDEALARQAQARSVEPNPRRAAQILREVAIGLGTQPVREIIARRKGMLPQNFSALPDDQKRAALSQVAGLPFEERLNLLESEMFANEKDPVALDRLLQDIPDTERQTVKNFFLAPGGRMALAQARKNIANASGAQIEAGIANFQRTDIAAANKAAYENTAHEALQSPYTVLQGTLYKSSEEIFNNYESSKALANPKQVMADVILGAGWLIDTTTFGAFTDEKTRGSPWSARKKQIQMAMQLRNLGLDPATEVGRLLGQGPPSDFNPVAFTPATSFLPEALDRAKRDRNIPADALIGPGGQVVTPDGKVSIYNIDARQIGNTYAVPRQPFARQNPAVPRVPGVVGN